MSISTEYKINIFIWFEQKIHGCESEFQMLMFFYFMRGTKLMNDGELINDQFETEVR